VPRQAALRNEPDAEIRPDLIPFPALGPPSAWPGPLPIISRRRPRIERVRLGGKAARESEKRNQTAQTASLTTLAPVACGHNPGDRSWQKKRAAARQPSAPARKGCSSYDLSRSNLILPLETDPNAATPVAASLVLTPAISVGIGIGPLPITRRRHEPLRPAGSHRPCQQSPSSLQTMAADAAVTLNARMPAAPNRAVPRHFIVFLLNSSFDVQPKRLVARFVSIGGDAGQHAPKSAIGLDFARLRDHSPANFDWEGALWRRKRCSNFRGW
jgi:hypothetical protein